MINKTINKKINDKTIKDKNDKQDRKIKINKTINKISNKENDKPEI